MVARGEIYHAQIFLVFVKTTTSMAVGLFTSTLFMYYYSHMCVCKCSGSEIFERILTHDKIIPTFDADCAHLSTRLKACNCPKRDNLAKSSKFVGVAGRGNIGCL